MSPAGGSLRESMDPMVPIRVLYVPANGDPEVVTMEPTLRNFRALIDGYLEAISGTGWMAYVDEEGKLKRRPENPLATLLAHEHGWPNGDVLVGDVAFLGPPRHHNETSVPDFLVAWLGRVTD